MPNITSNLGPGSTGSEVQALQQYLVQQGYLSQSDYNTGPGTYGPKTTAAVTAWQKANGVQPASATDYGYFGPLSRQKLQQLSAPANQSTQPASGLGSTNYTNQLLQQASAQTGVPAQTFTPQQTAPTAPGAAPAANPSIITAPRTGGGPPTSPTGITSNLPATPPPLGQNSPQIQSNLPSSPPMQPGTGGGLPPLPPVQSQAGSLSAFADALDAAVGRAKQQRNQLIGNVMEPQQGTLMASDFNSIIGNLNNASANFSTGLVNRAMDAATPQFQTMNVPGVGLVEYQMDSLGQITGQRVVAPEQAQPYQATTFEQNGTMYQYYVDPKTGAAVSSPQPIFSSPQSQQYQYQTFEQDGTMYQYAVDPNTGQAVSSPQPIFSGKGGSSGGTKYDYQTGSNGEIFEYTYGANGQLQNVQQIGQMPQELAQQAASGQGELRSVSGVGLVMVKPDGSYQVVVAEKDKPSSSGGGTSGGGLTAAERRQEEIGQAKQALWATAGPDGKVNTEAYRNAYNNWDGTEKEFFQTFPPSAFLNENYDDANGWAFDRAAYYDL